MSHDVAIAAKKQAQNDNIDWQEPLDIGGAIGVPALTRDALPDGLGAFIWDRAESIGVDPAVIGMGCLITCAAAISDGIKIQPKRHDPTWTESPRLWGAVVGDPSTKKTPGLDQALKAARKLDIEATEQNAKPMEKFTLDVQIYKKQLQRYTTAASKGGNSEPAPTAPTKPKSRRLVIQDTTTEALSEVLVDNVDGVLVHVDELSGFFGSMDAYRSGTGINKDRPLWLQAYNGGRVSFDRIGRGRVIVPNWSACVIGGIQPGPMKRIAANIDDDGLLQRFMIVIAQPAAPGIDRAPDMDAINGYRDLVRALHSLTAATDTLNYTLSAEAHAYREKVEAFSHAWLTAGSVIGNSLAAHLGKWGGLFARLLLTFHLIEHTARGDQAPYVIDGRTAQKVHKFMTEFLFPHSLRFYDEVLGQRIEIGQADESAGYILAHGCQEISVRKIAQSIRSLKNKPTAEIQAAMEPLVNFSWAEPIEAKPGKPANKWLINPAVHDLFSKRAAAERDAREKRRELMRSAFGGRE